MHFIIFYISNLTWQQGDIETLPFPDASFSLVLSRYAFHHFLHPDVVLSEMVRVCRCGGRVLIADVTLPPDKVDAYDYVEKLRDPSHTHALSLLEFSSLIANAHLQDVKFACYHVELELEQQLAASFPNPGDDDQVRKIFREDIGVDLLGVSAHFLGDKIHYAVPITVIVGEKAA